MRDSRGAHAVGSLQPGAGRRFFARRDLPEHLNASRFGKNSADSRHLTARQSAILRSFHLHSEQMCLQTPFLKEARPNRRKVRLGVAQRGGRCVDRVRAEDEIVIVRDGRAENEFSVGEGLELDRLA
jgi:hypothetical protein